MAKIASQKSGLTEIWSPTWLIKAGTNHYFYSGSQRGLKAAIGRVESANAGRNVTYRKIVE
ncbi:MAG: hypothetical protein WC489_08425 [Patescibacteria group bacterium]|jgi:hypothetical protein